MPSPRIIDALKAVGKGVAFVPFVFAINAIPAGLIQKYGHNFLTEKERNRPKRYQIARGTQR